MIEYRPFRNTDPPALAEIWNDAVSGRGAFPMRNPAPLDRCVLGKPYFDPAGLIVAAEEGRPVGFVHAGFGPNPQESALNPEVGIICAIAVRIGQRRQGIGSQLLKRAETYLRTHGAHLIFAGPVRTLNPFYFGLYGGSDSPGFLTSDPAAAPFFEYHGYNGWNTTLVFQRKLDGNSSFPIDPRFTTMRRRYDVQLLAQPGLFSWWQECVLGLVEPVEFRLTDKLSGNPAARLVLWETNAFRTEPAPASAGVLDVQVRPELRRQGLAKFLFTQMLRYLQDQYFTFVEVQTAELNQPAVHLYKALGFEQVDVGRTYRLGEPTGG